MGRSSLGDLRLIGARWHLGPGLGIGKSWASRRCKPQQMQNSGL